MRSSQKATQLIACVTSKNIVAYGFGPVLKPFIDDVNELCEVNCVLHTLVYM